MKPTFKKPTQSRVVAMNGRGYAWDAAKGLDPSVALEVEGFIRKKAWGYTHRGALAGLEFEDLVQEGWTGALKAAKKFNPEAGANYLTYAAWWIDAAMKEALSRPIIRTPEGGYPNKHETRGKVAGSVLGAKVLVQRFSADAEFPRKASLGLAGVRALP